MRRVATLTKTGRSRISRANCPRWPGSTGAAQLGRKRPVSGRSASPDLPHLSGKLPAACHCQRRTTREADLSTQQTGAQAPSRLPRPPCDDRRPQGSRRSPRAGPQAPERLSRASRGFHHGSAKAAGGLPRRCQWRAGQQRCLRAAKPRCATMTARSRVGFTVTKKNGTATERNRIRRRLRELVKRLDVISMRPHSDYVLVGRRAALNRDFATMLDDLRSALGRLERQPKDHMTRPPSHCAFGRSRHRFASGQRVE